MSGTYSSIDVGTNTAQMLQNLNVIFLGCDVHTCFT